MISLKIGERWKFRNIDYDVVVEVCSSQYCKIVQIVSNVPNSVCVVMLGRSICGPLGGDTVCKNGVTEIYQNSLQEATPEGVGAWTYLEGQDKPAPYNNCEYREDCVYARGT